MSTATLETSTTTSPSAGDRAIDTVRQVAHGAHEARLLKTLAADTVEDGLHAARRTVTRRIHDIEDLRDAATYRIKRAPFTTVTAALGAGILLGMVFGWFGTRSARRNRP